MARVLVVDDAADLADLVARLLRAAEHAVATADDGEAALAALAAAAGGPGYDLVLLDVMMPGVDGFGVLAAVRADPRTAALPVIMLSAVGDPASARRAAELGAQDYLVKGRTGLDDLTIAVDRHAGVGGGLPL